MKTTYVFLLYNHTGNNSCKNDVVVEISNGKQLPVNFWRTGVDISLIR